MWIGGNCGCALLGLKAVAQSRRPLKNSFTSAVYNWRLFSVEQKLDKKKVLSICANQHLKKISVSVCVFYHVILLILCKWEARQEII